MFVPFVQYLYYERTIIAILGLAETFWRNKGLRFWGSLRHIWQKIRWGNTGTASDSVLYLSIHNGRKVFENYGRCNVHLIQSLKPGYMFNFKEIRLP